MNIDNFQYALQGLNAHERMFGSVRPLFQDNNRCSIGLVSRQPGEQRESITTVVSPR